MRQLRTMFSKRMLFPIRRRWQATPWTPLETTKFLIQFIVLLLLLSYTHVKQCIEMCVKLKRSIGRCINVFFSNVNAEKVQKQQLCPSHWSQAVDTCSRNSDGPNLHFGFRECFPLIALTTTMAWTLFYWLIYIQLSYVCLGHLMSMNIKPGVAMLCETIDLEWVWCGV